MRNSAFRQLGINVSVLGLANALHAASASGIVFFISEVAHQSVFSALRFIGLGDQGMVQIRVDDDERIRIEDLKEKIAWSRSNNLVAGGLVLTAATTGCGAIDPLEKAISIANDHAIPTHVDAAHGGMLLLSARYRSLLSGIQNASSVTIDPHKILGVNQSLGFLAVRNRSLLDELGKVELQYYPKGRTPDLGDRTVDNSRSLNSLGAWIMIRATGHRGYEAMVDHLMDLSESFRARIREHQGFEILCDAPMNVVAFRPIVDSTWTLEQRNHRVLWILSEVLTRGDFAISRYTTRNGEIYLRAVFVNPVSMKSDVDALAKRITGLIEM